MRLANWCWYNASSEAKTEYCYFNARCLFWSWSESWHSDLTEVDDRSSSRTCRGTSVVVNNVCGYILRACCPRLLKGYCWTGWKHCWMMMRNDLCCNDSRARTTSNSPLLVLRLPYWLVRRKWCRHFVKRNGSNEKESNLILKLNIYIYKNKNTFSLHKINWNVI
jgi:hypothetical protein